MRNRPKDLVAISKARAKAKPLEIAMLVAKDAPALSPPVGAGDSRLLLLSQEVAKLVNGTGVPNDLEVPLD